jgi:hypothetical protein
MGVSHTFKQFARRVLHNVAKTLLLKDSRVNGSSLAIQFPRLYNLTFEIGNYEDEGWRSIRF